MIKYVVISFGLNIGFIIIKKIILIICCIINCKYILVYRKEFGC